MKIFIFVLIICVTSTYSSEKLSPLLKDHDLTCHYTFENLSKGKLRDNSSNRNDSTNFNARMNQNGIFKNSCDLSHNGYIDLSDFRFSPNFTLSLWVNIKSVKNGQCFIGKHKANGDNLFLFGIWDGGYNVDIGDQHHAGGKPYTGWQHLILTSHVQNNGTFITVYHNGQELWSKLFSNKYGDTKGKTWTIGQDWDGQNRSDFFYGEIDEVALFKRVLSRNEILRLHKDYAKHTSIRLKSPFTAKTHNGTLQDIINPRVNLFNISVHDFEREWANKFGTEWTDKYRSSARSTEKIPFMNAFSRETIFKFRQEKLSGVTLVFYN